MAGYAASAWLQGGAPRFAGQGARFTIVPAAEPLFTSEPPCLADRIELVGRPLDERLADWRASLGQAWTQLTFFLFDPDSWR